MKKVWRKGLSLLLTLCMVITMAPAVAWAAGEPTSLDVAKGNVVINSDSISGYDENGDAITAVNGDGYYLMSSGQTGNTVTINCDCTIYLGGLDILVPKPTNNNDYSRPNPINIDGSYNVTMILVDGTTNTLASEKGVNVSDKVLCGSGKAAIRVPAGASLTIEGDNGVLNATGAQGHNTSESYAWAGGGAGIGGNGAWAIGEDVDAEASGSITICGGVINATGGDDKGYWGAGGAGIGGGGGEYRKQGGASEEITITGGTVTVAAGKGQNTNGNQNVFTPIGAGGSGSSSNGKAETKLITVTGGSLILNSNMELSNNMLTIGEGGQLVVSEGKTLTIPEGVSFENQGTIDNKGEIAGKGEISGGGAITGEGDISNPNIISVNLTINNNNGSETITKSIFKNTVFNVSELETPARSGYRFRGWTVNGEYISEITVAEDMEIVAQWKKKSSSSEETSASVEQEYKVSVDSSIDNGKVEVSPSKAEKGDKVTITVTPDEGYVIEKVTVKDADGSKLEIKEKGNGEYTFTMPDSRVEIKAIFAKAEETPVTPEEVKPIILTINQRVTNVFGKPVVNDVAPVIRNNRTMLPIRFVAEALGASVAWDDALNKVSITKGEDVIDIYIGSAVAFVNGNPIDLDSPAFIENSRTYLPLRFVAESLGAAVSWNAETQEVTIVPKK